MRSAFVCGRHIVISQLTGKTEPVERATFVKSRAVATTARCALFLDATRRELV